MKKFFAKNEIKSEKNFHLILKKKKIVVFVPESFLEKVFSAMSDAGAGKIGNYDQCSFRINGTGSFRPNKNARSFSGKKNNLSFENEIRLEMECNAENVSSIVNAMLKSHPYEETAYEIYDFNRLNKKITGSIIELNRKTKLKVILNRLNKKIISETKMIEKDIKRIVITESPFNDKIKNSAEYFNSDLVIICRNNKYKLFNLLQ